MVAASSQGPVVVVGLDGGTLNYVKPWAEQGKLPTFQKLLAEGCSGVLLSTLPPVTCPAWPSFMTGKNPGKHGLFDFIHGGFGGRIKIVSSRAIDGPVAWDLLSRAGKRVCVVNVPVTYPPSRVNGVMVTGMLTPPGRGYTYPGELREELEKKFGYRVTVSRGYRPGGEQELLDDLLDLVGRRGKTALYLFEQDRYDFFMVVFQATDIVSHFFYRYMDPGYPGYDEELGRRFGDAILRVYQRVDRFLAKFLDLLPGDATLLLISDHGHGPLYKSVNLNLWLLGKGFLSLKRKGFTRMRKFLFDSGFSPSGVFRFLDRVGLQDLVWRPSRQARDRLLEVFLSYSDVDWSKTLAYSCGHLGQVWINRKGREPFGVVGDSEYDKVLERVSKSLFQLRNPETGELVVSRVYRGKEIYHGPYAALGPDLVLELRGYSYIAYPLFADSNKLVAPPIRGESGNHRREGLFIALGPEVRRGAEIGVANIVDVAPTILYLLGLDVPRDMDGRVIKEMFKDGYLREHPPRVGEALRAGRSVEGFSEEESREVEERLRRLGYLG